MLLIHGHHLLCPRQRREATGIGTEGRARHVRDELSWIGPGREELFVHSVGRAGDIAEEAADPGREAVAPGESLAGEPRDGAV